MYKHERKQAVIEIILTIFAVFLTASLFARPAAAAQGVAAGIKLCVYALIPSMFPFLVLSKVLLQSRFAALPGILLRPYLKLLRIREPAAGTALLMGLLGGFAAGACAVGTLHEAKRISQRDASVLLCCSIGAGPGFLVNTVGVALLGNAAAGWLLVASSTLAGLICAVPVAFWMQPQKAPSGAQERAKSTSQPPPQDAVRSSVMAMLSICGFIVFFSFVTTVLLPENATGWQRFFLALPLEITTSSAAAAAIASPYRLYLCGFCVSVLGASVLVQVRSLTGGQIPLAPLECSRLLHLPVSALILRGLLLLFPSAAACSTMPRANVLMQLPADAAVAVFVLLALLFSAQPAGRSLRHRKNGL